MNPSEGAQMEVWRKHEQRELSHPLTFLWTISQCQVAELEVMHLTSIQYTPPSAQTWKRSSKSILMSKYVAESINQTTDCMTFWPHRPLSTAYDLHCQNVMQLHIKDRLASYHNVAMSLYDIMKEKPYDGGAWKCSHCRVYFAHQCWWWGLPVGPW